MKKSLILLLTVLSVVSCKKDKYFSSIDIYYYGHSELRATFEIPIKFYVKDKIVLSMDSMESRLYLTRG